MRPNVWSPLLKSLARNSKVRSFSTVKKESSLQGSQHVKGKNVPMYMACGAIFMSTSLGLLTAAQELVNAPNVMVNKKKRKEIPEVEEPDYVLHKSEEFLKKSIFRKLGTNSKLYQDITRAKSIPGSA